MEADGVTVYSVVKVQFLGTQPENLSGLQVYNENWQLIDPYIDPVSLKPFYDTYYLSPGIYAYRFEDASGHYKSIDYTLFGVEWDKPEQNFDIVLTATDPIADQIVDMEVHSVTMVNPIYSAVVDAADIPGASTTPEACADLLQQLGDTIADYVEANTGNQAGYSVTFQAAPNSIFSSADTTDEITTVLTLGYLFGTDCEQTAVKYAQTSWNVISQVNDAIAGISDDDRQTYIALTMFIYICQNDSTFNTTAATAGGIPYYKVNSTFASAYEGTGSLKMGSTEALSNYSDVDILLNCRSMDWGLSDSSEVNALIIDTWDHYSKSTSYLAYFAGFEDKLVYINNLLPGAVKVAYMAHFMYGDKLSLDWADGVLQDFIDMGLDPLEGQTTSSILSYVTQDTYNAAKAATFS